MKVVVEMDEGNVFTTYRFFKKKFSVGEDVYYVDRKQHGLKPKVLGYVIDINDDRLEELKTVKGVAKVYVMTKM